MNKSPNFEDLGLRVARAPSKDQRLANYLVIIGCSSPRYSKHFTAKVCRKEPSILYVRSPRRPDPMTIYVEALFFYQVLNGRPTSSYLL